MRDRHDASHRPSASTERSTASTRDVVVVGHTHMQFDAGRGIRWVNAGSVGMPYEGEVAAFWALLGDDVEFRRTPFDVERAVAAIERDRLAASADEFVGAERAYAARRATEAIAHFEDASS